MVKNSTNARLETPQENLQGNNETLQRGLKILARIIARSILVNTDKDKPEKILERYGDDEDLP